MRIQAGKSNYKGEDTDKNAAQRVFDVTLKFIQIVDVLTLCEDSEMLRSVDNINPPLLDVQQALKNYPKLP